MSIDAISRIDAIWRIYRKTIMEGPNCHDRNSAVLMQVLTNISSSDIDLREIYPYKLVNENNRLFRAYWAAFA
jgi:hypothetical protein